MRTKFLPGVACSFLVFAFALPLRAEVTKSLEVRLPGAGEIAVENLVGNMRIYTGQTGEIVVSATIHAESRELADTVSLDRIVSGEKTTVHVRYPLDRYRSLRYPSLSGDGEHGLLRLFNHSWSHTHYDGESVRIGNHGGRLLYVDLEVRLPAGKADARFQNRVGRLRAEGLQGRLRFELESCDARLEHLNGDIEATGSSGDIRAFDIQGNWDSRFTSGDLVFERFRGDSFRFASSSGDLRAREIAARRVESRATSGDARLHDAEIQEFSGRASSGDIEVDLRAAGLAQFEARSSSGDVLLRLPRDATFSASVHQTSGDFHVRFRGGERVVREDQTTGYRVGSGGARIDVETTSGDFTIAPR
jgi:hypothetical protein